MDQSDLSPELKLKAKQCTTAEELTKLAQSEGFELTSEQLEKITGGSSWDSWYDEELCDADCL